jgi:ammonium transporter, Amt family
MKKITISILFVIFMFTGQVIFCQTASGEVKPFIDSGNTAWVLISTALVMFMTVPALAFFYGGLVKRKNVLNVLMQCFLTLSVVCLLWVIYGYSISFSPGKGILSGFIGSFDWAFLKNVGTGPSPYFVSQANARIPHLAFMIFQGMFAAITPALIIGAFAERMKFSTFIVFIIIWSTLVYFPVVHWVWAHDGWLNKIGVLDFAGGIVVHVNAGIASLVTAIIIGKRRNLKPTPPHNLTYTLLGAGMLWFGWFGFNGGSALAADGLAVNAFVVTNTASATAAVTWAVLDWIILKKPTILGVATGAIAGLATITPASGFVDVSGALCIGFIASIVCYLFVMKIKPAGGYDDALDAFGVHGIGGIIGSIATGIFATSVVQASYKGFIYGNPNQLFIQLFGVGVVLVYSFIMTFVIYKLLDKTMGVRVSEKEEAMGLDVTQHNERGYTILE